MIKNKDILFIKIKDPDIVGLIKILQNILNNNLFKLPPHITIRGPYYNKINENTIENLNAIINYKKPIIIQGVDYFINDNYILYFSVHSEELKKMSWKKEFPKNKFGFNPHITIYQGNNFELIKDIKKVVNNLNFSLEFYNYELARHTLGDIYNEIPYDELFIPTESELIKKDILYSKIIDEIKYIANKYNLTQSNNQLNIP